MGSGFVEIRQIWAMLDECAPGHRREDKPHHWWIFHGEKIYMDLRKGEHKKRKNKGRGADVELRFVRGLARALEIDEDCIRRHFPTF